MSRTIVNPSSADYYFDVSGNATTSTTQPSVNKGRVAGYTSASLSVGLEGNQAGKDTVVDNQVVAYSGADGQVTSIDATASFPYQEAGKYVIPGYSTTLAGKSNTIMQTPGSDFGTRKSILSVEAVRTVKTTTAIRNNQWSTISGDWITDPAESEDLSTMGTDAAVTSRSNPPDLHYMFGTPTGVKAEYETKTTA